MSFTNHSRPDRPVSAITSGSLAPADPGNSEFARAPRLLNRPFHAPTVNYETIPLAHPFLWLILGASLFVFVWLLPAASYERFLEEPNFISLDVPTLLFNCGCLATTMVGLFVGMHGRVSSDQVRTFNPDPLKGAPVTAVGLVVVLTLMNLASVALFLRAGGVQAFTMALSGHSDFIHTLNNNAEQSGMSGKSWILFLSMSSVVFALVWVTARNHRPSSIMRWLFWAFVVTYFVAAICTGKRNYLARPFFSMMLIYFVWPRRSLSMRGAVAVCVAALSLMLVVFVSASVLRDDVRHLDEALGVMGRYMIAPFNNEALIVNNILDYPGGGTGYYWTEWFWDFPVVSDVLDLESIRFELFGEMPPQGPRERGAVLMAHGIRSTTNLTSFGASYIDFGWMGVFPFFVVGWIGGAVWKSFLRGSYVGILLYPQFAYSLVECRGNIIFPEALTNHAIIAITLIAICLLLERPKVRVTPTTRHDEVANDVTSYSQGQSSSPMSAEAN
ncbi:MAG: oligosaccharide repeat unit polymerase [Planctomycetaceae bacterium]|nr:oligosaccharide repeat unit polymerase [Planctomycetaceae bacterium]